MLRRAANLSKLLHFRYLAAQDSALHASSSSGYAVVLQHGSSSTWTRCQSGSSFTAADNSDTHLEKKAAVGTV